MLKMTAKKLERDCGAVFRDNRLWASTDLASRPSARLTSRNVPWSTSRDHLLLLRLQVGPSSSPKGYPEHMYLSR